MAHQFMHCFEGHRVLNLSELKEDHKNNGLITNGLISNSNNGTVNGDKTAICPRHKNEILKYYCRTCAMPICKECCTLEHPAGLHEYEHVNEAAPKQLEAITHAVQEARTKATDIR